jgi:hypothetical protein
MADNATASPSTAPPVDPWSMTPQEASEQLAAMQAAYDAQSAPQVPSAEAVQDARDAEIRLAKLTSDPAWVRKYTQGSIPERREYEALTSQIAAGVDETGSVAVGEVETLVGDRAVPRAAMIDTINDLLATGIPEEGVVRTLNADFSEDDILWAQNELDKAMATPAWRDALLAGDPTAKHEFTAWCAVVAAGRVA